MAIHVVTSILAGKWKVLTEIEKQPYVDLANEDKEKFSLNNDTPFQDTNNKKI